MSIENAPSGTIRSALRYPDFRRLVSGLAVSQIGDYLYNLAGANAARSAVTGAGIVLGPALGGVLLLLGSPAAAFALNALTFGLAALAVLAIRAKGAFRPRRAAGRPDGILRQVAQGAAAL